VLDNIANRCEPSIMEATLLVGPQAFERRCSILHVRSAIRLKVVDSDLGGGVHVPTRFSEDRRYMATCAIALGIEYGLTPLQVCR
jgi:hypothetical protein